MCREEMRVGAGGEGWWWRWRRKRRGGGEVGGGEREKKKKQRSCEKKCACVSLTTHIHTLDRHDLLLSCSSSYKELKTFKALSLCFALSSCTFFLSSETKSLNKSSLSFGSSTFLYLMMLYGYAVRNEVYYVVRNEVYYVVRKKV